MQYIAISVETSNLVFDTQGGSICFRLQVRDIIAGQKVQVGLRDRYYIQANCAIIMLNVLLHTTRKTLPNWKHNSQHGAHDISETGMSLKPQGWQHS